MVEIVLTDDAPATVEAEEDRWLEAAANTILLLDHYHHLSEQDRDRFWDFWRRNASEKKLKLILTTRPESLGELLGSLKKYSLSADNVELKPLDSEESREYIRCRSCAQAGTSLQLNSSQQKQLTQCRGNFKLLGDFIAQHQRGIRCVETLHTLPPRYRHKARFAWPVLLVAMAGLTIYFAAANQFWSLQGLTGQEETPGSDSAPIESIAALDNRARISNSARQTPDPAAVEMAEPSGSGHTSVKPLQVYSAPLSNSKSKSIPTPASTVTQTTTVAETSTSETSTTLTPTETPPAISAVPQQTPRQPSRNPQFPPDNLKQSDLSRLQQRQLVTSNWLAQADAAASTIQVMTVVRSEQSIQAIEKLLQKLEKTTGSLNSIGLYEFKRGPASMLGLLYGRYTDTATASREMKTLPEVLRSDRPMVRTVRGIRQDVGQSIDLGS